MDPCDTIIKLVVSNAEAEPGTTDLHVHQGVLCKTSEFFKRALKPEWASRPDDPNAIDLSDEYLKTVTLYVQWLYSGELQIAVSGSEGTEFSQVETRAMFLALANAYVFGEKYMDIDFKNTVLTKLVAASNHCNRVPGYRMVAIMYAGTSSGSPIRRLVSDNIAHYAWDTPAWERDFEGYPLEALVDAVKALVRVRPYGKEGSWRASSQDYLEKHEA